LTEAGRKGGASADPSASGEAPERSIASEESDTDPERPDMDAELEVVEKANEARRRGEVLSPEDLMLLLGR
jgi:hypothetical protein